jgi:hypothetical protein
MPITNLPDRSTVVESMPVVESMLSQPSLQQWWEAVVSLPTVQVQVRQRGNILYVLCESPAASDAKGPDQTLIRSRAIRGLLKVNLAQLLPADAPEVYQVNLYGKVADAARPAWMRIIYLSQIQEYALKVRAAREQSAHKIPHPSSDGPSTALLASSNLQLAQQGLPEAIARHLSEMLSQQGIAVRAGMKALWKDGKELPLRRLVIYCEAAYSPDPAALIEPIAERLRSLHLSTFRDAVVYGQVQGEAEPDWKLRIDLTPPTAILREWARWGDLEAMLRLINQTLAKQELQASGMVLDMVLHVTCWRTQSAGHPDFDLPDQQWVVRALVALFEQLAPQGVHALCLYGTPTAFPQPSPQQPAPDTPGWEHRSSLAAASQLALSDATEFLAKRGDVNAIAFLLTRLLNPDIDRKLATGGVRIQSRHRHDLLHVMVDAPQLPEEKQVVPLIAEFLRGVKISSVNGVRIYGRRTGETQPRWKDGYDFASRDRLVPEATLEFAASEAFVGDLITQQSASLLRPELSADEAKKIWSDWMAQLRQRLLATQLFSPLSTTRAIDLKSKPTYDPTWVQDVKLAAVWSAMGILVTVCADWGMGIAVPPSDPAAKVPAIAVPQDVSLSGLSLNKSRSGNPSFSADGFTGQGKNTTINNQGTVPFGLEPAVIGTEGKALIAAPLQPKSTIVPAPLSFNAPQLDEKVRLYEQFVAQSGVPDVMIVGSSRAMRGLDPVALQETLAAQGYSGRRIFNFGVNGATAQVVELIVRRLIAPEKLPKLIIWADGARALNSGRIDLTYNAIATSPAYAELPDQAGAPKPIVSLDTLGNTSSFLAAHYESLNQVLNKQLSRGSAVYGQRSELVGLLWSGTLARVLPAASNADMTALGNEESVDAIDVNGFLPLSVRFNPITYYQKFARVTGPNDADYASFQLQGRQADALKSVSEYVKTNGKNLVFVNLPLTTEYLDADRREHEAAFQQFMIQSAAVYGFTYRNLAEVWKNNHQDYFSDPSHLNRYGAYAVSRQLSTDALIPWGAQ